MVARVGSNYFITKPCKSMPLASLSYRGHWLLIAHSYYSDLTLNRPRKLNKGMFEHWISHKDIETKCEVITEWLPVMIKGRKYIPKSHLRRCVPQLTLLDAASVAFGPRSILSDPEIPALIPRPGGHPINSSHSRSTKNFLVRCQLEAPPQIWISVPKVTDTAQCSS